jgi:Uncharacterized conserved protein
MTAGFWGTFAAAMNVKDHTFTLGIEEEFAIVDPETRELRSHSPRDSSSMGKLS